MTNIWIGLTDAIYAKRVPEGFLLFYSDTLQSLKILNPSGFPLDILAAAPSRKNIPPLRP
jgi:hypothetical protein